VSGVAPPAAPPPPAAIDEDDAFYYEWVDVHGLLDENVDLLDGSPGL
jgi:hypothetical protein